MVRAEVIRKRLNEYIEIDRSLVYENLQHGLADLQALKRVFASYL